MRRLILAAALAAATVSAGFAPAFADTAYNGDPGVNTIGVDTSTITLDHSGVMKYLDSQSPDARKAIEAACHTYSEPMNHAALDPQTQLFCAQVPAA